MTGEVVSENKWQIDHLYTDAVAELDDTKERGTEMKGKAPNDAKDEADEGASEGESSLLESLDSAERLPESTVQKTEGKKVNHDFSEQHEREPENENVDLNMEVWSEHDSKIESYKVIMCSDGIQRRGGYALF